MGRPTKPKKRDKETLENLFKELSKSPRNINIFKVIGSQIPISPGIKNINIPIGGR